MRERSLEDTFYIPFTTRAFATGIPGTLGGSPVLSVLEENNATPITAGVSVSVDRASVAGLNEATIVATAANGYEEGKSYSLYISTGTVDGVSVVGEVVGEFSIGVLVNAVIDEVLTGATHNVVNSLGRKIRLLAESGSYELGLVWLDSVNGTAGSTDFENGTNVLPLTTPADANTILASLALHGVHVAAGSTVTFAASQENQEWTGADWTLALGGQSIAGITIVDAIISGISTGVPGAIRDCFLNASTFAGGDFISCALGDTITLSGATGYHFFNCHHAEMGASSTIDFGAAVGATEVHIHNWHGKLTILNMKAGDILHFSCSDGSLTLDSTCVAGTINLSGTFGFTDSSSGTTINDLGQMYQRVGAPVGVDISADIAAVGVVADSILVNVPDIISLVNINAECDTALIDYDGPTNSEMNARTLASASYATAANLALVPAVIASGTANSGSLTSMTDSSRTEADAFWKNMRIRFTSGPNIGLSRLVYLFTASTDVMLFAPTLPFAVASGHTYEMLPADGGSSLEMIRTDPQSLLDFKDLVDDGYDPATNQINGCKLTDLVTTTTTSSDMRGTDDAAIASNVPDVISLANINAQCDTALTDIHLDHLLAVAHGGVVATDSVIAKMVSKGGTAFWSDFVNTFDSLQAISDRVTEVRMAELDAANLPADIDTLNTNVPDVISLAAINAEMVDVVNVDVITLPGQGAPPLTPTMRQMEAWLYKMLRNRTVQTATQFSLYADDQTTIDTKAVVSDDVTTAIKQELVSGP